MRVILVLAWLGVWEAAVRNEWVDPILIAKPTSIVVEMFSILGLPEIRQAFATTLVEYVSGFAIGAGIGILLGIVLALVRPVHRVLHGPLMVLYATPKSIFIPLFVAFLGLGVQSPTAFAALESTFPVMIAVLAGVSSVDPRLTVAASALGATPLQRIRFVVVPSVIPPTISGIWLGLKQALLAVLMAELLIAGGNNIGFHISLYASTFQPNQVYALIVWLSLFAIAIAFLWGRVEAYTERWRTAGRGISA